MGTIILIIAGVIEIALGVYCIATKSGNRKLRSFIRIFTFAAFVIFALASVIEWGFRWYPLAAVLFIFAAAGSISLIRKKEDVKKYRAAAIALKAVAMWLVVFAALVPALVFPQYKHPRVSGEYKVDTVIYTYTDKSRIETFKNTGENRKVTAQFWYPKDTDGRFPLVVFSHGAFGLKVSNTSTFKELASNGYIVCSIDHPYHSMFTKDTDGSITVADRAFLQEVVDANGGVYDEEAEFKIEQKWLKLRTDDMNFVIDTIVRNAKDAGAGSVYQLIDTGKMGLMGHSLGGAASAQLGRQRSDIKAVIDLDGSLLGEELAVVNGKTVINDKIYPVPILSIYTDAMMQAMSLTVAANPDVVIPQKLISSTAPHAFEVYFKGTNHMSVTDLPLVSPFLVNMINSTVKNSGGGQGADKYYVIEKMNSIVLEFFNCYLKDKGTFNTAGAY